MGAKAVDRYQAYLPAMVLSGLSIALIIFRVINVGSTRFVFMAWNLMLAWLPLLWAWLLIHNFKKERWLTPKNIGLTALWLAFLPNSFYLVTDLIHLRHSSVSTVLFDAVMLMSFALSGLLLGCMGVYMMHVQLAKRLAHKKAWASVLTVLFLCSLAIYLGRYLRWNSWDLVFNPFYIFLDLSDRLLEPERLRFTFGTTMLFFCFVSSVYFGFYTGIRAVKTKE